MQCLVDACQEEVFHVIPLEEERRLQDVGGIFKEIRVIQSVADPVYCVGLQYTVPILSILVCRFEPFPGSSLVSRYLCYTTFFCI